MSSASSKVNDLRKTLSDLGLSATGSKDALLARLRLHEKKQKKKNEREEDSSLSLLQTNSPHSSTRKMTTPGKKSREITKPTSSSSSLSLQDDIKVISTRTTSRKSSAKENRKRASNASVETIIDSSDDDDEPLITYQGPVQVPFKLLNPITNQYKVMPVMTYELNPSMAVELDGLALRLHEKRQKMQKVAQQHQQPLKYNSNLHSEDEEIVLSD